MSNTVIAVEIYEDIIEELKPLLEEHWKEIALYQDKFSLDPAYDKYQDMSDAGSLNIVTCRIDDEIVGYFIAFISKHLHYKETTYATNDILYLAPEHRGGELAYKIFSFAEQTLKDLGVDVLTLSMKTILPFDSLCEALGYTYVERTYSKYIKDTK